MLITLTKKIRKSIRTRNRIKQIMMKTVKNKQKQIITLTTVIDPTKCWLAYPMGFDPTLLMTPSIKLPLSSNFNAQTQRNSSTSVRVCKLKSGHGIPLCRHPCCRSSSNISTETPSSSTSKCVTSIVVCAFRSSRYYGPHSLLLCSESVKGR